MLKTTILTGALTLVLSAGASAQSGCTRETLTIKGVPVTAAYCVTSATSGQAAHELSVQVAESYSSTRGSVAQQSTLAFISGEATSRVIEDVPLARLGLEGTLHVTLVYHGGLVRIESALLTPGAIAIK